MDKESLTVRHALYGIGVIIKRTDRKIYVLFGKKQRIFDYPEALKHLNRAILLL